MGKKLFTSTLARSWFFKIFVSNTTEFNFRVTDLKPKVKLSKDLWPKPPSPMPQPRTLFMGIFACEIGITATEIPITAWLLPLRQLLIPHWAPGLRLSRMSMIHQHNTAYHLTKISTDQDKIQTTGLLFTSIFWKTSKICISPVFIHKPGLH